MTDPESGLQSLLGELAAEGRYFETSQFTLDSLKAREKLSQFQLADSGLWLVKLVQAAVASGAPTVSISFGKRLVRVQFANTQNWAAETLLHEVLSGRLDQERALAHLITGLRASAAAVTEQVTWSCGGAKVVLNAEGSSVTPTEESSDLVVEATRPSRQRTIKKTLTSSVFHLAKQTIEEFDAISSRCWVCPIAITLDGKELLRDYALLNGGFVDESPVNVIWSKHHSRYRGVRGCLICHAVPHQGEGPEISYPLSELTSRSTSGEYFQNKPLLKFGCYLRSLPNPGKTRAIIGLFSDVKTRSSLDFVCDGALVKRVDLPELARKDAKLLGFALGVGAQSGLRITLPVEPEQLDLSQFNLRDLQPRALLRELYPLIAQVVDELKARKKGLYYIGVTEKYAKATGIGVGSQIAFIAAITNGAALLPIALGGGVGVAIGMEIQRSQLFKEVENLVKRLDEYVGVV